MKKLLASAALAVLLAGPAEAGNAPYITGPWDPSAPLGTLNNWINTGLNPNTYGIAFNLGTSAVTSGTSLQALATYTIPAGNMLVNDIFHMHAAGTNSADANAKTITFSFGAATCACVVTGSGLVWRADAYFNQTGAATQLTECHGVTGTTPVTAVVSTGSVSNASAITATISGTAATSGTITLNNAFMEYMH